jgi:hypothetical protein
VYDHSPYEGKRLVIHLAIADIVNTDYDNEFWMSNEKMAKKSRCTREYVNKTLKLMVTDGFLVPIGDGMCQGAGKKTVRYRFVMPNVNSDAPVNSDQVNVNSEQLNVNSDNLNVNSERENDALNVNPVHINPSTTTQERTQEEPKKEPKAVLDSVSEEKANKVEEIWSAYLKTLERCGLETTKKLTKPRLTLIANRLNDYTKDELIRAVEGLEHSPFHRGDNDARKVYDSIELILRSDDHIERFSGYHNKVRNKDDQRRHVNDVWGVERKAVKAKQVFNNTDAS